MMQTHLVKTYVDELEALVVKEYGEGPGIQRIRQQLEAFYGLQDLPMDRIRMEVFVAERLAFSKSRHAHRDIRIETHLEISPPVRIPSSVLQKIVDGLVKNAIENTPDGGRVEIATRATENGTLLEVSDWGVGISEAQQTQIFKGYNSTGTTMQYARRHAYDFNAGGNGADLLRMKIFSERYGFSIAVKSSRCTFLPLESDLCPGKISSCTHCHAERGCHLNAATVFSLSFPPADETTPKA
jgi:light-regulated signal transduction histidine kinase (bacteriophytochrome)